MRRLLAGVLLLASVGFPQDKADQQKGAIWRNPNLETVVELVHKITGKQFIYTDNLNLNKLTVHFITNEDLTADKDKELLFRVFQAILERNNLVVLPFGEQGKEIYKIAPKPGGYGQPGQPPAGSLPAPVVDENHKPTDAWVTRLFKLKYIRVESLLQQLRMNPQMLNNVTAIEDANALMVTDNDYSLKRLEEFIKLADVKKPDFEIKSIQLKHALATNVAKMLEQFAQTLKEANASTPGTYPGYPPGGLVPPGGYGGRSGQQGLSAVKIVDDPRTNSVLLLAEPDRVKQLEDIIKTLDGEAAFETTGIWVYSLKHAKAKDTAEMVLKLYEKTAPGTAATTPTAPGPMSTGTAPETAKPVVSFDERTNSIIVVADRNTYKMIEGLLNRIDKRRPQLLLKASVVEVRSKNDFNLAVELARLAAPRPNHFEAGGKTTWDPPLSTVAPDPTTGDLIMTPTSIGTPGVLLAVFRDNFGYIPVLAKALEGKAHFSVHDEPEILTQDNAISEIKITDQRPFLKTVLGTPTTPSVTTADFAEANTKLKITPHISESQEVQLEMEVLIEKFVGQTTQGGTIPPAKTGRTINIGELKVRNGRTVVIGGLQTEDQNERIQQVPLVGDIPLLGNLFKSRSTEGEKRTLYVFVTPYILYDERGGDMTDATRERKDRIEKLKKEKLDLPQEPTKPPAFISSVRFASPKEE